MKVQSDIDEQFIKNTKLMEHNKWFWNLCCEDKDKVLCDLITCLRHQEWNTQNPCVTLSILCKLTSFIEKESGIEIKPFEKFTN